MVHERISVEDALPHLDYVQVVVAKGHAVPQNGPVSWLRRLPVAVLANNILYSVDLGAAVVGVDHYHRPPDLVLLFTVHHVVFIILVWIRIQVVDPLKIVAHGIRFVVRSRLLLLDRGLTSA